MVHPDTKLTWSKAEQELADFLSGLCAPPSSEPTEVWAEQHVMVQDGPFAGSLWRLQFTPLAKFVFAAMRDPQVRRVTLMMSAQNLKTLALLIDFLRNCKEDPADTMWVMAEADHMGEFIEKRLMPYIEGCDVVAPIFTAKRKSLIRFQTLNLLLRGSNSRAKLQSDPVRRVYLDERREWKKGAIDLVRKRMRTYPNSIEISAGTAGNADDDLHADCKEGSMTRAHFNCPKCGHSQPWRFGRDATAIWPTQRNCGGLRWVTDETTKPNGKWDYTAVRKTVYYECENEVCKAHFTNADKYDLLRTLHPHDYNPSAPRHLKSFTGSALEAVWESCDWDKLVEEFLKAIEAARAGNLEPLKAFITETLGEPWQDQLGVIEDFGFLQARQEQYDFGEVWPEELSRFMAADVQEAGGEHYWWVIRAFGRFGKSRLIAYGRATSKLELEEIRKQYQVPINNAMIDSGWKASEIYRFCLSTGWKPFKGEPNADYFLHRVKTGPDTYKTVRRIWERTLVDPFMGQKAQGRMKPLALFRHVGDATKDLLAEYMAGLVGEWTIPEKVGRTYLKQMTAERRVERKDPKGRISYYWKQVSKENHLFDDELIIIVAAVITKHISAKGNDRKVAPNG